MHATPTPRVRHLSLLLLTLAALLPACGKIVSTNPHPATTPDQIQILTQKPAHYERLGTVSHLYTDGSPWQTGADATPIIQDLLTECGNMGANALLLTDDTTSADSSITMTYHGQNYQLPVISRSKTVLAQGIFVTK